MNANPPSTLPIRRRKYDMRHALVQFTPGGCAKEYHPKGQYSRSFSTGGCETPETFFEPSHWWAHAYRQVHVKSAFEGVPYIDTRHLDGTAALRKAAICGPMVDVTLEPGTINRLHCHTVSRPLASGLKGDFAALLALHLAHEEQTPGPLDYVSLDLYLAHWKRAGAIVGEIRKGKFIPF